LLGVISNLRLIEELIYHSLWKLNSYNSKIIIKQPTRKTLRFLRGKPSNTKVKTTGPSAVKSSSINNNKFTIVFPREISRGNHHIKNICIIGLNIIHHPKVDFNKIKERFHQVGISNQVTGNESQQSTPVNT
jgi:hypothetical protein